MSDKKPMPVSGDPANKGKPDGVGEATPHGRTAGGESGGGAYPNPQEGKKGSSDSQGFMGHGGQTTIDYHGGGQAGAKGPETANATTERDGNALGEGERADASGKKAPVTDDAHTSERERVAEQTHEQTVEGRRVEVFETSGVSAAETSGMTGVEGQEATSGEQPGSG